VSHIRIGGCCSLDCLCEYHVRRCKCLVHQPKGGVPTDSSIERAGKACVFLHECTKCWEADLGIKRSVLSSVLPYNSAIADITVSETRACITSPHSLHLSPCSFNHVTITVASDCNSIPAQNLLTRRLTHPYPLLVDLTTPDETTKLMSHLYVTPCSVTDCVARRGKPIRTSQMSCQLHSNPNGRSG
jgi:hypothetical protein